jgi:hypothetical protein
METEYIRCISFEKAVIVFVNNAIITDSYEATEDGQKYLEDIQCKKGSQINVELMQENNDRYQVMFVDDKREPIGWIMKRDITIVDMTTIK